MPLKVLMKELSTGRFEISLEGRLDSATYQQLESVLVPVAASPLQSVRFDLARLDYISSMGLRVFLKLARQVSEKKAKMQLVNLSPPVRRVFDIGAALPGFDVFSSVEEADRYFDKMQKEVAEKNPKPK